MVFNSLQFTIFFIIVSLTYFILPYKYRCLLLLIASYYFYACSKPEYLFLLFLTTLISYISGLKMAKKDNKEDRKPILVFTIILNFLLLLVFKYFNSFGYYVSGIFAQFNIPYRIAEAKWIVPLGISFYTLQIVAYLMDVYRGEMKAEKNFCYFALYSSFFLTILSGPIERGKTLIPQFHEKKNFNYERISDGLRQILWGMFKKLVIADALATYVNPVYDNVYNYKGFPFLVATLFFAVQLYCDFSGYTDMAIGCAKILGYDLIKNFNLPYFSQNVQEFWRRWHISLSTWFKDYLYIPLGGNRVSKTRNYFNLLLVFLASGIWHGTTINFAIWGGLHGIYQIVGKFTKPFRKKTMRICKLSENNIIIVSIRMIITFILVDFAWIFFRAKNFTEAKYVINNIITCYPTINSNSFNFYDDIKIALISIVLLFIIELIDRIKGSFFMERLKRRNVVIRWIVYYIIIIFIIFSYGDAHSSQFIYSRF